MTWFPRSPLEIHNQPVRKGWNPESFRYIVKSMKKQSRSVIPGDVVCAKPTSDESQRALEDLR